MKIIIPMAGSGQRFVDAGYKDPKPLIKLQTDNRRIIEHVLDMFPGEHEFIFICNDYHLETTDMEKVIKSLKPNSIVISMPPHKKGPVYTVMPSLQYINDNEEVIIAYCDGTVKWNLEDFKEFAKRNSSDGIIVTHSQFHPHTLSSTKMAFTKLNDLNEVIEIKEKSSYTDNPMLEHASSGIYYFKKGQYVKEYFQSSLEQTDGSTSYNGEFYITLVYNLLIKNRLKVNWYDTSHVAILGTPHEVKNFEAWAEIVKNKNIKTEQDLLNCYRYWKAYHNED